jgi:hypothetical protein
MLAITFIAGGKENVATPKFGIGYEHILFLNSFICTQLYGGNMLQVGRWRVRFLMRLLDFLFDLILPAALEPWGKGGKGRLACKAEKFTAICEPSV